MAPLFPLYFPLAEIWSPQHTPQICHKTTFGVLNILYDYAYLQKKKHYVSGYYMKTSHKTCICSHTLCFTAIYAILVTAFLSFTTTFHGNSLCNLFLPFHRKRDYTILIKDELKVIPASSRSFAVGTAHGSILLQKYKNYLNTPHKCDFLANATNVFLCSCKEKTALSLSTPMVLKGLLEKSKCKAKPSWAENRTITLQPC